MLVELGSVAGELTLATFVNVPLAGDFTIKVRLVTWLFVKVPKLQLTKPLLVA